MDNDCNRSSVVASGIELASCAYTVQCMVVGTWLAGRRRCKIIPSLQLQKEEIVGTFIFDFI